MIQTPRNNDDSLRELIDKQSISSLCEGRSQGPENTEMSAHYYVSNRDGSARWIFPVGLKKPTFLNFYNDANIRGRVIRLMVTLTFYVNRYFLRTLRGCNLPVQTDSVLGRIRSRSPEANYSIFTGTVGENRKLVIEINHEAEVKSFAKVPISRASTALIENEHRALLFLKSKAFTSLKFPEILLFENGVLEVSDVRPRERRQRRKLTELHHQVMIEIYQIRQFNVSATELSCYHDAHNSLCRLSNRSTSADNSNGIDVDRFSRHLTSLKKYIEGKNLECGVGHGDFTPWNMFIDNNCLHVIDWEMFSSSMPLFLDAFHFIFQSEILVGRRSYSVVKREIRDNFNNGSLAKYSKMQRVDLNAHFAFYLFWNVSREVERFSTQEHPHVQIYWLCEVWEAAILDFLESDGRALV